jgi:hypothetical protein
MILDFDIGDISWYIDQRRIGGLANLKPFLRSKELYFLYGVRDSNIEVEFIVWMITPYFIFTASSDCHTLLAVCRLRIDPVVPQDLILKLFISGAVSTVQGESPKFLVEF